MRLLRPFAAALLLTLSPLAACNSSTPTPFDNPKRDASVRRDAAPGADAAEAADVPELGDGGPRADAASDAALPTDAGTEAEDAGPPPADAGLPTEDAGPPPADGGPSPEDSGLPPDDAGPPPTDAGPALRDAGAPFVRYTESALPMPVWIDACALGAVIPMTEDDDGHSVTPTTLPFPFSFFGTPVQQLWADTNGYATFDAVPTDEFLVSIPDPSEGPALYAFWGDLIFDDVARICIATVGTAPNRQLVIGWHDMVILNADGGSLLTFEAVLHEGTGVIDLVYATLSAVDPAEAMYVDGSFAGIGLQSAMGAQWIEHAGTVAAGSGIRFTP